MVSELEGYLDQLLSIKQDAPGVVSGLSNEQFNWRPAPERWSIAECFDHLNVTARLFVPVIDAAIAQARERKWESQGPFVYPIFERLFLRFSEPPPKVHFRAPKAFRPTPQKPVAAVMPEFMNWQDAIGDRIRRADGIDLRRARQRSPGLPLVRWSLGTTIAVTLAHERRHIWQAREVRKQLPQ